MLMGASTSHEVPGLIRYIVSDFFFFHSRPGWSLRPPHLSPVPLAGGLGVWSIIGPLRSFMSPTAIPSLFWFPVVSRFGRCRTRCCRRCCNVVFARNFFAVCCVLSPSTAVAGLRLLALTWCLAGPFCYASILAFSCCRITSSCSFNCCNFSCTCCWQVIALASCRRATSRPYGRAHLGLFRLTERSPVCLSLSSVLA